MICFGPVPSRRLGRSLGINNIPPKVCSYSCIYCQLGSTIAMRTNRQAFYEPRNIFTAVHEKVVATEAQAESIDYLTFVPDGEPTLDMNLDKAISLLKSLNIKIAAITNSSLMDDPSVRDALMQTDLVSLKMDAVSNDIWHHTNRPHGHLELDRILNGLTEFTHSYQGKVLTETMLVSGVNDSERELVQISSFLKEIGPDLAYIAVPTRPPAEAWVQPPDEQVLNMGYQAFGETLGEDKVEHLVGYEGDAFASTGDAEADLLSITAVHPMRREAVERLLDRVGVEWAVVEKLILRNELVEMEYQGNHYYMRRVHKRGTFS